MSLPDFKAFTLKDWLYFVGVVLTLAMSWAVLNQKVSQLNIDAQASWARQEQVDKRQDETYKETARDIKDLIKEQTREIKDELKDLRKDLAEHSQPKTHR
jgi:hypothetical protein